MVDAGQVHTDGRAGKTLLLLVKWNLSYSAFKEKEIMSHVIVKMNIEVVMREIRQPQKKCHLSVVQMINSKIYYCFKSKTFINVEHYHTHTQRDTSFMMFTQHSGPMCVFYNQAAETQILLFLLTPE